jgi:hypothetical protein
MSAPSPPPPPRATLRCGVREALSTPPFRSFFSLVNCSVQLLKRTGRHLVWRCLWRHVYCCVCSASRCTRPNPASVAPTVGRCPASSHGLTLLAAAIDTYYQNLYSDGWIGYWISLLNTRQCVLLLINFLATSRSTVLCQSVWYAILFVALRPNAGHGPLIHEVSR